MAALSAGLRFTEPSVCFLGRNGSIAHNIRAEIKSRVDEIVDRLDLVPRSDLERVEAILQETRKEHEELKLRIEALEKPKKKKKSDA